MFNRRQAWKYIKLHDNRELLNVHSNEHLTIDKAVALLSEPQEEIQESLEGMGVSPLARERNESGDVVESRFS